MKKTITVIVGYARSGVTLLDRYLSSDKRLVCLSEINSRYACPTSPNTIQGQIKSWYNLDLDNDLSFIDAVCSLLALDKQLVVRDWSFGSFVPLSYNDFRPTMTLNTIDDLKNNGLDCNIVCLVRNPVDVWLSMNNSKKTFHDKDLGSLESFILDVQKRDIHIVRYEDFCINPNKILTKIYNALGLSIPNVSNLSKNVTGDINFMESSRGATLPIACSLPRRAYTQADAHFIVNNTRAKNIAKMLSYKDVFFE